ncbi:MAG: prepilin-type N-terminal cleavage/methylation domain-containing protein [Phycisphaerae bacterium]|nr:prepilin-type N-terminal cleavage/methylation domain-containing protein [Phycisphaerae bacterium]MDW8262366.1 prepilin-type N-terminal cleavage/methylation domain-containing protein [Phycisphaerales bacterium]
MNRKQAFTLVELLVVIGIIALLIGILIPALSKAQQQAKVTACLSNIRQLTQGWIMYANEYKGSLVWAETLDEANDPDRRDGWVIDVPGNPDTNTRAAIEKGLLWKYAPAAETYRCPASYDLANFRSYSINTYMNGRPSLLPAPAPPPITKLARAKSKLLVFIEEYDERGVNQGSFFQFWVHPMDNSNQRWNFGDVPAFFHKKGTNMSFADGHAEHRTWSREQTLKAQRWPHANGRAPFQTGNTELLELRRLCYGP